MAKNIDWIDELARKIANDQLVGGQANLLHTFMQDDPDHIEKTDPERYKQMKRSLITSSRLYDPKNDEDFKMEGQNDYE